MAKKNLVRGLPVQAHELWATSLHPRALRHEWAMNHNHRLINKFMNYYLVSSLSENSSRFHNVAFLILQLVDFANNESLMLSIVLICLLKLLCSGGIESDGFTFSQLGYFVVLILATRRCLDLGISTSQDFSLEQSLTRTFPLILICSKSSFSLDLNMFQT